ncbi:OmpA/MotB family protein [Halochromatium glycolicum]|uniref:Flagellar motor protein MotB n=1 Tax=Halochromatium glycolicum TaxID=85075 RepID=A0AAJ0X7Q3_9GAMM|nr:OmpA family protein [Halochromatium glycolicum]MBK1703309.1 flagellar motor protein MotB [Halochromatium glycolicum]
MLERNPRGAMQQATGGGDGDSWLMSYLDVLTLLITLFVLLLSLAGSGKLETGQEQAGEQTRQGTAGTEPGTMGLEPRNQGILPRNAGLQPRFQDLDVEGVSVAQGEQGITLRIDDNLLFASGDARLTASGREVIKALVPTLEAFDGQISVEGHTDNIPISTARFPSNWELSMSRAIAVLRYFIEAGIPEHRLRAIGYADTEPLESNETAAGRAANRRVEILVKENL